MINEWISIKEQPPIDGQVAFYCWRDEDSNIGIGTWDADEHCWDSPVYGWLDEERLGSPDYWLPFDKNMFPNFQSRTK